MSNDVRRLQTSPLQPVVVCSRDKNHSLLKKGGAGKANVEALKQAGINSVFYESPNTAHEWLTWRRSLYQFAPRLFKN